MRPGAACCAPPNCTPSATSHPQQPAPQHRLVQAVHRAAGLLPAGEECLQQGAVGKEQVKATQLFRVYSSSITTWKRSGVKWRQNHGDATGLDSAAETRGGSGGYVVWACLQSTAPTCPKDNLCPAEPPGLLSTWKKLLNDIRTTGYHTSSDIEELWILYRAILPAHLSSCFLLVVCLDLYIYTSIKMIFFYL